MNRQSTIGIETYSYINRTWNFATVPNYLRPWHHISCRQLYSYNVYVLSHDFSELCLCRLLAFFLSVFGQCGFLGAWKFACSLLIENDVVGFRQMTC